MATLFLDTQAKMRRVEQHIEDLEGQYREIAHHGYISVIENDVEAQELRYKLVQVHPVPVEFRILVGEVMCGLNEVLDNILWALMTTDNGHEPTEKIYFPATIDDNAFEKKLPSLPGLKAASITALRELQPYHAGNEPYHWLHDVCIVNKHHRVPLASKAILGGRVSLGNGSYSNVLISAAGPREVEPGAVYGLYRYVNGTAPSEADVQAKLLCRVLFDKGVRSAVGLEVRDTVLRSREYVQKALLKVQPLLL